MTRRLLAVGLGVLLLLELTVRLYLFGLAGFDPLKVNSTRLGGFGFLIPSPLPALGWEQRPNASGYLSLAPLRINSRGLRDKEYPVEKPPQTRRVAVMGSSFTVAPGVEIERTFHSLLETRLSREFAPINHEFINFAVGAYNASQILSMLKLRALEYEPDLILFAMTTLSARWVLKPARGPNLELVEPLPTFPFLRSFLVEFVQLRSGRPPEHETAWDDRVGILEKAFIALTQGVPEPREAGAAIKSGEWHGFRERPEAGRSREGPIVLNELGEIFARTGIPILLVRLDTRASRERLRDRILRQRAEAAGIHYVDTRDALRGIPEPDLWIFESDPHPNARAHEIYARVIDDYLRSSGLLTPNASRASGPRSNAGSDR